MTHFRFALFILLLPAMSFAQDAGIIGNAPHWAGREIRLLSYSDPISKTEIRLDTDTIREDGTFKLQSDINEISQFWLAVNRFKAPIFLTPGRNVEIAVKREPNDVLIDTWQMGTFVYIFPDLDSVDVNAAIAAFDAKYYDFFVQNSRFLGSKIMLTKVREFESSVTDSLLENEFLHNYIHYSIAEMKLTAGVQKNSIFELYIQDKPLNLNNPAWYALTDLFYASYFDSYDSRFGGMALHNRFSKGLKPEGLDSLMAIDDFLQDQSMRYFVMLKSTAESLYDNKYKSKPLLSVLNWLEENAASPVTEIAKRIRTNYISRTAGFPIDSLHLAYVGDGLSWSVEDSLPTYLITTASWNTESQKELDQLRILHGKYKDHFRILHIDVAPDEKIETEDIFLSAMPEDVYDYLNLMGIYSIPDAVWIDPDGTVRKDIETPGAGDELEKDLFKLKVAREEQNKLRIGQ